MNFKRAFFFAEEVQGFWEREMNKVKTISGIIICLVWFQAASVAQQFSLEQVRGYPFPPI